MTPCTTTTVCTHRMVVMVMSPFSLSLVVVNLGLILQLCVGEVGPALAKLVIAYAVLESGLGRDASHRHTSLTSLHYRTHHNRYRRVQRIVAESKKTTFSSSPMSR